MPASALRRLRRQRATDASLSTESPIAHHTKVDAMESMDVTLEHAYEKPSATPLQHSSSGSNFLRLPRELRDQIYALALGCEPLHFDYRNVIIAAALHHDVLDPGWGTQTGRCGLPAWMHSSKQIKMEALDVIARTFTFTVAGPSESHDPSFAPPAYQDVFRKGLIKKLLIRTKLSLSLLRDPLDNSLRTSLLDTSGIATGEFLLIAKELGNEDMALDMWWIRYDLLEGSEWHRDELALCQGPWDEGWNKRFRRVKMTVTVEDNPRFEWGDETPMMAKQTEDFAKRLLGRDAEVVHFALPPSNYPCPKLALYKPNWMRGIVAERKI